MENNISLNEDFIIDRYVAYLLDNGDRPKNIFLFAKEIKFEEYEFYRFFSSFEHVEKEIITHFFNKSIELVNEDLAKSSVKEKLLNAYFIFFENLTINRSIVLQILGDHKGRSNKVLEGLKASFFSFLDSLDFKEFQGIEHNSKTLHQITDKSRKTAMWLHLLSVLQFWKSDESPSFEKTDLYIEKTIDTGFEIVENTPLKKVIDLGKFLLKEKL